VAARRAGVQDLLIGALDAGMMEACAAKDLPCVLIDGGNVTRALASRSAGNVRNDPRLYPKMSVLKVGFYKELLSYGFNVWACDADALLMHDPRPLMASHPWSLADVAIATDCIDLPGDARDPLLHCDFNTGLVYLRTSPAMIEFTEQWREKVANAKEARIRDQAAFNMLTKASGPPLERYKPNGTWMPRIYLAGAERPGGRIKLGVLPLSRFLNGHTFFVQHAHQRPHAEEPMSVHMTYQFAEGSSFAYGKRQRLREANLWFVDDDAYYSGRFVTVSAASATLPVMPMNTTVDTREAVAYHLREHAHRLRVLRSLLGIAKALGRSVILPRMVCYCDFLWKEMRACRVGGAESMALPFDCPMDHVTDTPRWFENSIGVGVREPNFLLNPRVPKAVSGGVVSVSLPGSLNDEAVRRELAPHAEAAVLELEVAADRFCGFADEGSHAAFVRDTDWLLSYQRVPFCMMEGTDAPLYSQCCTPRNPTEKFFPCVHGFDPPTPMPTCTA